MNILILSIDKCLDNLKYIGDLLSGGKNISIDSPTDMIEHLNIISSILGMSSEIMASLKYHLQQKKEIVIVASKDVKLSPSILKEYIDSKCSDINAYYNIAERYNSSLSKRVDALRTMISFVKEDKIQSKFGQ